MVKYFQIVEKSNPLMNGNVFKLDSGKLEMIAGEPFDREGNDVLKSMDPINDSRNIIHIDEKYIASEIEEEDAKYLLKDWDDYALALVSSKNVPDWRDV